MTTTWCPGISRPHSQNVRRALHAVVEADGAVQTIEIRVAGLGWVAPLDSIYPAACHHVAGPVQQHINLLFIIVMMWEVGAPRLKRHHVQVDQQMSCGKAVSLAGCVTHHELINHRIGMTAHQLGFDLFKVGDLQLRRRWGSGRHLESHYEKLKRYTAGIRYA